jgi:tetratricopeptide (TPR) repeat protein
MVADNPRDFSSYYYLGSCLLNLKMADSSRRYFAACVTLNHSYAPAMLALASLTFDGRDYHEALRLYSACAALSPNSPDIFYRMGLCNIRLEDYAAAETTFRRASELDPERDIYHAQLGYVYLLENCCDSAAVEYERAILIDRDNPLYYVNLALAMSKLNRVDQAVSAYQQAVVSHHPENISDVYVRLGSLYFLQKRFREAEAAYQKAVNSWEMNKEARFYLALTMDRLNEKRTALQQYRRYLRLASDDTTRKERERKREARGRIENLQNR